MALTVLVPAIGFCLYMASSIALDGYAEGEPVYFSFAALFVLYACAGGLLIWKAKLMYTGEWWGR